GETDRALARPPRRVGRPLRRAVGDVRLRTDGARPALHAVPGRAARRRRRRRDGNRDARSSRPDSRRQPLYLRRPARVPDGLHAAVRNFAVRGSGHDPCGDAGWHSALVLIDLGGADTYRFPAGATTDADHGVAVVVDVAGTDSYEYDVVANPRDASPVGGAR